MAARQVPHGWWRRRGLILAALATAATIGDGAIAKVLGEGCMLGTVGVRTVMVRRSPVGSDVGHVVVPLLWVGRVVGGLVMI